MISRAEASRVIEALPVRGAEAGKIRALLRAYGTEYDFCRFFVSETHVIARFYGDLIISGGAENSEELAEFLSFGGFSEIFCSEELGDALENHIGAERENVDFMRFCGVPEPSDIYEPTLREAFEVIGAVFGAEFEPWYLDMSHRVRHGVSRVYANAGAVLAVQHDINGEALLSQVASLPENRGKGHASRLISAVCKRLAPSEVFVLCSDGLVSFYEKNGFNRAGTKSVFRNNG